MHRDLIHRSLHMPCRPMTINKLIESLVINLVSFLFEGEYQFCPLLEQPPTPTHAHPYMPHSKLPPPPPTHTHTHIHKQITSTTYVCMQSLTRGNGFYLSGGKEPLWVGRKLVVRDKETGVLTSHCV